MKISFHGAAQTVTGSKHIVHSGGKKILLDCGIFQGLRDKTRDFNAKFGFKPESIDMVVLSHAHIDHSGLLPKLVKEGYTGPIYCTEATADLASIMLQDSAYIQEADTNYVNKKRAKKGLSYLSPLYTIDDAKKVIPMFKTIGYNSWHKIDEEVELMFTDAGHILGSACVHLKVKEHNETKRVTYSGDVGRYRDVILKSPETFPQADYIILESTYGTTLHDQFRNADDELLRIIQETCVEQKGRVIIPAFSVGRTQELLYDLNMLELENRLPDIEYYVDSPLSVKTTAVVKRHPDVYNKKLQELQKRDADPFEFKGLKFIKSVDESKALNARKQPMVIISASGMADAGRVKHHIANAISDERNTICIVGYCEPSSLGAKLARGDERVRIYRDEFEVKAKVEKIRSMSAHADYNDLCQFLACQNPKAVKKMFLVHGEFDRQMDLRAKLMKKGFLDIVVPEMHETIGLG